LTEKENKKTKPLSCDALSFVRTYDFRLIPRRLLDQVKGSSFDYDALMEHGAGICMHENQLLYVMVDEDNIIHGILWAEYSPINNWVYVNTLSVDPEYQDGRVIERSIEHLRDELKESITNSRIVMGTTRPDAYEKQGFKKMNTSLMEIEL